MKKQWKRLKGYAVCLSVLFGVLVLLAGCGNGTQSTDEDALTVHVRYGSTTEAILREQFPDIPFVFSYYDGKNPTSDMQMHVQHHDISDIYIGSLPLNEKDATENLLDLSGYNFCNNYEPSILNQYDINGKIYQVPAPLIVRCIAYNKDMFAAHGWQEPQTFDELVALCAQIRAETDDITPIVFGGAGVGYYFTTMTTFAQTEYLHTLEGKAWERDYLAGKAKAADGFGSGIQMTQQLIDAGAFDYSKNASYWDAEIFKTYMENDEAAMQFVWGGQDELLGLLEERGAKYGFMPFRNYRGDAFLGTNVMYSIGLSKNLAEPGNEAKLKNALRVMEWFSTEDGQNQLSNLSARVVYPIKNTKNEQMSKQFHDLWYENLDGIKAPMLYVGYEDVLVQAGEYIAEAMNGEHDLSGLASMIDELHQLGLQRKNAAGSFTQSFTHQETVQMMAEILHSRGDSDITLVSDGARVGDVRNMAGVHSRFYEGDLYYDWLSIFIPGCHNYENKMMQLTLTGAQIQELLEQGKHMVRYADDNNTYAVAEDDTAIATARYDYYWTGMTVEMKNGKVTAMTLSDGTPVEPEHTYTVSFAEGDYMDTTAAAGHPVDLGYTVIDVFSEYLQQHSPLRPVAVCR